MATTYVDLHDSIRALVGDTDEQNPYFSASTLNQHIKLFILREDDPLIQEGATGQFETDLTNNQKAKVIFSSARTLLAGMPDQFQYKTPILSVNRKAGIAQRISFLDSAISDIFIDDGYLAAEGELDAMINGADRWIDDYDHASSEGGL